MSIVLRFPDEQPELEDLPPDAASPAPAPTLMPSAPPPPPPAPHVPVDHDQGRGRGTKTAVGAVAAVAAAVALIAVVALVTSTENGSPAASPTGGDQPAETTESVEDTVPSTTSPVPTDEDSARQLLDGQVASDRARVEALTGFWVPQLSSKRVGLVVNGTTYDHQAIWSDFTSIRARYPGALLLWSGDYTSFRLRDFWVTIVPEPHVVGEDANGWCDNAGIAKEDCYAKRITHTDGYAESTLLRK